MVLLLKNNKPSGQCSLQAFIFISSWTRLLIVICYKGTSDIRIQEMFFDSFLGEIPVSHIFLSTPCEGVKKNCQELRESDSPDGINSPWLLTVLPGVWNHALFIWLPNSSLKQQPNHKKRAKSWRPVLMLTEVICLIINSDTNYDWMALPTSHKLSTLPSIPPSWGIDLRDLCHQEELKVLLGIKTPFFLHPHVLPGQDWDIADSLRELRMWKKMSDVSKSSSIIPEIWQRNIPAHDPRQNVFQSKFHNPDCSMEIHIH